MSMPVSLLDKDILTALRGSMAISPNEACGFEGPDWGA
jgi:hypothetical protein